MEINRIKWLRTERNMTRQALADEMNISLTALATYERGEREPSAALIVSLAEYFKVTSDFILGLSDDPYAAEEWPHTIPIGIAQTVDDIKKSIEEMISSVRHNSYGYHTLKAYAAIIKLLSKIDSFAEHQLYSLKMSYPNLERFGKEGDMLFDGKPLLLALADVSNDAGEFARQYSSHISAVYEYITNVDREIQHILLAEVTGAIKGQPLERVDAQAATDYLQRKQQEQYTKFKNERENVQSFVATGSDTPLDDTDNAE